MYPMEAAYPLTQLPASDGQPIWVTALMSVKRYRVQVELAYWTEKRGTRKQNCCYNFHFYIFTAVFHGGKLDGM